VVPLPASLLAAVDLEASFGVSDSSRSGVVYVRSAPPEALGFPARSVEASVRLRGEAWTVDSIVVRGAGDKERLRASGSVEAGGDGGGGLSASIRATALPVSDLSLFTAVVKDLEGELDGEVALTGTLDQPRIRGALGLRNGAFRHYPVGSVRVDSLEVAGDSLLFALRFDGARGEKNRIAGRLPVRANLREQTLALLREEAVRVDLQVPAGDLRSLALLLGRGDEAIGSFRCEATLRGTPARPDLNGTFEAEDALVFPAGVTFFFERTDARLLLDENYITIVSMEARSGNRGRVHAWGRVDLQSFQLAGYDISFHAQDYDMTLADNIEVTFDGDLTLRPDSTILRMAVPHIAGRAELRGALVTQEFGAEEVGPSVLDPSDAPEWTCDIFLRAPRNLWVRNSLVDVELAGEAQVRRSDQGLGALGRFEVLRGSYYIYPNEFRIRTGEVLFTNADDLRQAEIDVTAETRVLGEKIEVHAYGGADDIRVEPASESGYSESEILSMLALRNRPEENVQSGEVLSSWFQTFASRLSREMSKGLGDIGTIEIGTSEDLPELRYGNYVSSDLYVGFSQKIDAGLYRPEQERSPTREYLAIPDRELRVEYRLRRSLLVEGEVGTLRSGERFLNLDLKVRVSY
jgi:autotransporter translocation and assembly factor TamB